MHRYIHRDSLSYRDENGYIWRYLKNSSSELAEIDSIYRACFGEEDYARKHIHKWLSNPNFYMIVAEFDGRIVGN
jgi:hypothetical protein